MPGPESPQPGPQSERPAEWGPEFVDPEQESSEKPAENTGEQQFITNSRVAVVRRSGQFELDWRVGSTDDNGRVRVIKNDEDGHAIYKLLPPNELANMQPHFPIGLAVEVPGVHLDDLRVVQQNPNGSVILGGKSPTGEPKIVPISAVELHEILNPPPPEPEAKKRWFRRAS